MQTLSKLNQTEVQYVFYHCSKLAWNSPFCVSCASSGRKTQDSLQSFFYYTHKEIMENQEQFLEKGQHEEWAMSGCKSLLISSLDRTGGTACLRYVCFTNQSKAAALLQWWAVMLKCYRWALGLRPRGKHLWGAGTAWLWGCPGSAARSVFLQIALLTKCFALEYFVFREDALEFSEAERGIL